jgi:hypothetical protein
MNIERKLREARRKVKAEEKRARREQRRYRNVLRDQVAIREMDASAVVDGCTRSNPCPRLAIGRNRVVTHEPSVVCEKTLLAVGRNFAAQLCDHERTAVIDR